MFAAKRAKIGRQVCLIWRKRGREAEAKEDDAMKRGHDTGNDRLIEDGAAMMANQHKHLIAYRSRTLMK
jgi:hypothetical protein